MVSNIETMITNLSDFSFFFVSEMDFNKLNEIASFTFLPTKKWENLENKNYMVVGINKVNTKFGRRMVFIIEDDDVKFQIFVPTRVSNTLYKDEEMFDYLIAKANKLELFIFHKEKGSFEFV